MQRWGWKTHFRESQWRGIKRQQPARSQMGLRSVTESALLPRSLHAPPHLLPHRCPPKRLGPKPPFGHCLAHLATSPFLVSWCVSLAAAAQAPSLPLPALSLWPCGGWHYSLSPTPAVGKCQQMCSFCCVVFIKETERGCPCPWL